MSEQDEEDDYYYLLLTGDTAIPTTQYRANNKYNM